MNTKCGGLKSPKKEVPKKEMNAMGSDFKFEILESIRVLGEANNGWTKELNIVSYNNGPEKFDIRDWSPEHDKMSKGITLTEDEAVELYQALYSYFEINEDEELQEVLPTLFEELSKYPDGYEITTAQLYNKVYGQSNDFEFLMKLHLTLLQGARRHGLILDMSKHDGLIEGMAFNLDYEIKHI